MTDNEIIKALECCKDNGISNTYCDNCAYNGYEDCGARQSKDVKFTIGQTWEIKCALKQTYNEMTEQSVNYGSSKTEE